MPWIVLVPLFPSSCDVSAAGATIHNHPNGAPLAATQRTGEGNSLGPRRAPYTQARSDNDIGPVDSPSSVDSTADALATTVC